MSIIILLFVRKKKRNGLLSYGSLLLQVSLWCQFLTTKVHIRKPVIWKFIVQHVGWNIKKFLLFLFTIILGYWRFTPMAKNLVELFVLSTRDMVIIYHMFHLFWFTLFYLFSFLLLFTVLVPCELMLDSLPLSWFSWLICACLAIVTGSPDRSILATDVETGSAIARLEHSHGWVLMWNHVTSMCHWMIICKP